MTQPTLKFGECVRLQYEKEIKRQKLSSKPSCKTRPTPRPLDKCGRSPTLSGFWLQRRLRRLVFFFRQFPPLPVTPVR
jgi:hypothetical protein